MTEMNVTNLLDTAFVLLMAFMIVAPAIKHGIEIDLPTVNGQNMDAQKTVTVVIQKSPLDAADAWIYVEDKRYMLEDLTKELRTRKQLFPKLDVLIEADKQAPFGVVAQAMGAIKNAGINDVGWVTQPDMTPNKKK